MLLINALAVAGPFLKMALNSALGVSVKPPPGGDERTF